MVVMDNFSSIVPRVASPSPITDHLQEEAVDLALSLNHAS
jgi:hypothetical protein